MRPTLLVWTSNKVLKTIQDQIMSTKSQEYVIISIVYMRHEPTMTVRARRLRELLSLALTGLPLACVVTSRFLFLLLVEKSRYAGYSAPDIEGYAKTIAEFNLNGLFGLRVKNEGLTGRETTL